MNARQRVAEYLLSQTEGRALATLLRVYDPTLNPEAAPTFLSESDMKGFVPLPEKLAFLDQMHVRDGLTWSYGPDVPHDMPDIKGKDFRVLLDGRPVRAVFEASRKGGWVRFLAPGPDGTPYSNRSVTYQARWGVVPDEEPNQCVTGLAFGKVEWLVRQSALEMKPAASVDDGG
jgi:hypothetical protein